VQCDPDFSDYEKAFDIREQLTPLWQMSYSSQLQEKFAFVVEMLDALKWNLARRIGDGKRPTWLQSCLAMEAQAQQLCCPLLVRTEHTQVCSG
jgi:hypothetical protein